MRDKLLLFVQNIAKGIISTSVSRSVFSYFFRVRCSNTALLQVKYLQLHTSVRGFQSSFLLTGYPDYRSASVS